MLINSRKLNRELQEAGVSFSGCNSKGIVWDLDGTTEIQSRPDISQIIAAHQYSIEEVQTLEERVSAMEAALLEMMMGG